MQQTLTYQLDELQKDGVNAIIFQVRPECDALYPSTLEPWSRFLTGQQGRAPQPYWDPLQWMIDQCHARGMELHAWINPYRAKTKGTASLSVDHIIIQHPERCFDYDGLTILNPALPENRDHICAVARDIVSRYDVDGIHMDDYFYPYPVAGVAIPDGKTPDQRREYVNLFIRQFYETVHQTKPWVKVGISPFGIYRNKRSSDIGSDTNGLQNYDDLYADILLWVNTVRQGDDEVCSVFRKNDGAEDIYTAVLTIFAVGWNTRTDPCLATIAGHFPNAFVVDAHLGNHTVAAVASVLSVGTIGGTGTYLIAITV